MTSTTSISMLDKTVPSPKPISTSTSASASTGWTRRLSLNIPQPPIRTPPLPVPARQGSISKSRTRASFSMSMNSPQDRRLGSSLSLSVGRGGWGKEKEVFGDDEWLKMVVGDIGRDQGEGEVVGGDEGMERAVEVLLASGRSCLLVDLGKGEYGFFDFSDLNVFLLLVLQAASSPSSHSSPFDTGKRGEVLRLLRSSGKVPVSSVCRKNPCHLFTPTSTLRTIIPLLSSGIHRVLLSTSSPTILTASNVLEHLVSSPKPPKFFNQTFQSPTLDIPLNPLISLYSQGSIMDAMQIMSLNNLSALGVLDPGLKTHHRRTSSSSSNSRHIRIGSSSSFKPPSRSGSQVFASPCIGPYSPGLEYELESPFESSGELINVITAEGCGRLVVPSQGREALGMGLGEATKSLQVIECAGQERGEERVPVHTISHHSSILHASHLILATSSSRVFLRTSNIGESPSLSPPPSPSIPISSLSLSEPGFDFKEKEKEKDKSGLPIPPNTVYSPHYVISITDILGALGRAYNVGSPSPTATLEACLGVREQGGKEDMGLTSGMGKVGTEVTGGGGGGLGSWKWAKEQAQAQATGQTIA